MKTSFFVLWLSMFCIAMMMALTHATSPTHAEPNSTPSSADTCACVNCKSKDIHEDYVVLESVTCARDQSPTIGSIIMDIESDVAKKFSYFIVDDGNKELAMSFAKFQYDTIRSKLNNDNCTKDSSISRYESARHLLVNVEDLGLDNVNIKYNMKFSCGPKPANYMEVRISDPNPKYYIGSKVRLDVMLLNDEDQVDNLVSGVIQVKGSKIQQGKVTKGRGSMYLTMLDEYFESENQVVEFVPNSVFNQEKLFSSLSIPLVRKASKGELLIHKNQNIYSGKEFTLYFKLFDSDNGPTPSVNIELLSIASPNNNLYCQITNYINGYGFATCENIDAPGEHSLVLKYNGAILNEVDIVVQENPYQYINEAIVLLLVILVIVSLLILCVGVVSFIIFYKKLNKGNGKNSPNRPQGRFIREEDAEELDNM